ncbi:hypothetical protein FOL47_002539 [Perkinsus chesapeaki]|uniref:Heparan-alpha-glucosaminide N-acetyltransferase catalytic domain-containing protein n=1 Tax=Perkinsus chesapeaki TaxID=330153 RepID=A0A7J6MD27_PERCH|nr:hypothetical protein FOL47_002539 [Perkinsus chesapeaki]
MSDATHLGFVDPAVFGAQNSWENFTVPNAKSGIALTILGVLLTLNLCVTHYIMKSKRFLKGFDPVSSIEMGEAGDTKNKNRGENGGDTFDEVPISAARRPRYPAIDFFRGQLILFVVTFHILWGFEEFKVLPTPPSRYGFNQPVSTYLCFAAFYVVSFCWFYLANIMNQYLCYIVYPLVTLTCIYMMYWESEVSGVCLLMVCVGVSLGIVHEDRIKWRNFFIRAIKLGIAAGVISAVTYIFMPSSPVYFGAIHCIWLNSNLSMIFIRTPRLALIGYFFIQFYTMEIGVFPLEVPMNRPTVDVIPWFHNLGYCLLGIWLHSIGFHKVEVVELIPGKRMDLEDIALTFFGRHISGVCLIMLCIGMSQAISHQNGIIWRSVLRRAFKLGSVACTLTVLTYILSPDEFIYFGAIHCILVNSLLSIAFLRVPWVALLGFVLIQGYTMKYGSAPWEVPQNIPTLDVIPWFHNFGYCLLGIWLHSIGVHKMEAISLPRRRILFEETVMTTFGRHVMFTYISRAHADYSPECDNRFKLSYPPPERMLTKVQLQSLPAMDGDRRKFVDFIVSTVAREILDLPAALGNRLGDDNVRNGCCVGSSFGDLPPLCSIHKKLPAS